jgi:hypothetical protein
LRLQSEPTPILVNIAATCVVALVLLGTIAMQAQTSPKSLSKNKQIALPLHATGSFEVKLEPQPADERGGGSTIGHMLLSKQFHGDLEATSKGAMLASGTGANGSSGGYVALEVVTGTLKGRTGTFVLQHTGLMNRGAPSLSVRVIPDSGTGQLTGIAGTMSINIVEGKHSYDLEYTLPESP